MSENQNIDYAQLELIIKKEHEPLKKDLSQNFLTKLNGIVNDAYEMPKNKKDNFICKEKTKGDLLKLFQSSKMFKNTENTFSNIQYLAVAEKETKEIGKIVNLNLLNKTVEYYTYSDMINESPNRFKRWSEVKLFDYNSLQLEAMIIDFKKENTSNLSYNDFYSFLSTAEFLFKKEPVDFGSVVVKSENAPVMKAIMEKYDIPLEAVAPPKRKLHCLDKDTLEMVNVYESVKEAASALSISASTISNVLCLGYSARNYFDAGGFKWEYSDIKNFKYKEDFSAEVYYPEEHAAALAKKEANKVKA